VIWDCQWKRVGLTAKSSYRVEGENAFSDLSRVTKKTSVLMASIQKRPVWGVARTDKLRSRSQIEYIEFSVYGVFLKR